MEKVLIGIDPGLDGAVAVLAWAPPVLGLTLAVVMPITGTEKGREVNVMDLRHLLQGFRGDSGNTIVVMESVHAMPGQGVSSSFKFGKTLGQIDATVKCCRLPLIYVTPVAWKKKVLAGMNWKGNKAASIQYCLNRHPGRQLKRTEKCKGPHDGICDAICIAEYGRFHEAD